MALQIVLQHISIAQAATSINILIALLQQTLGLGLAVLLIRCIPPVNTAAAWNVIGRSIHTSLWPTLLSADSESARGTGLRVAFFSYLSLATTVLATIAGVVMPLGLSVGDMQLKPPRNVSAVFIEDMSPLGLATSPRGGYKYGRDCVKSGSVTCGNYTTDTFTIPSDVVARFNATPYGPFQMQFRRYYNGTIEAYNYTMPVGQISMTESLILRTGIFAVGGLIVDMDNPAIGLWNHTFPADMPHGGVWTEDILFLEPVTACVDTNLTIDYTLHQSESTNQVEVYNLTDRGGFFNLTDEIPTYKLDGQNIDIIQHAFKGAVLSNFYAMQPFNNLTRNESYYGRTFQTNYNATGFFGGKMKLLDLLYQYGNGTRSLTVAPPDLRTMCEGYGGLDAANISNVGVHCNLLLAPPQRTDGGDPRLPADNSTWTQGMFGCASTTRARMQRVEFSFNGTMDLTALGISRSDIDIPVLWATERTDFNIRDTNLYWGRVPDSLERDTSLRTIRSDVFYVPAGISDIYGITSVGQPSTLPGASWEAIVNPLYFGVIPDYSGVSNYAVLQNFGTLILADPKDGPSKIKNMIWTDIMANNLMGADSRSTLLVRENAPSITYDLWYALPAMGLALLWVPSLIGSTFVLLFGFVKISHLRHVLAHTGAGRIALGNSALRPRDTYVSRSLMYASSLEPKTMWEDEREWEEGTGGTMLRMEYPDPRGSSKYWDSHRKMGSAMTTATEDSEILLRK
ncbi:hypothetical protein FB451DRAFT_1220385 [Mycena latifolia]|nr:hypothetical protein FB451DRAFT_1220385 [Mycena latifolia]